MIKNRILVVSLSAFAEANMKCAVLPDGQQKTDCRWVRRAIEVRIHRRRDLFLGA